MGNEGATKQGFVRRVGVSVYLDERAASAMEMDDVAAGRGGGFHSQGNSCQPRLADTSPYGRI